MPAEQINLLDCHRPTLACDSAAATRVANSIEDEVTQLSLANPADLDWLPHSFLIYPEILGRIHRNEGITVDEKTKETLVTVDFNNVDKFVPQQLYTQVQTDNKLFLAEKQVISNAFFKTTAFLLQEVVKQTDAIDDFTKRNQKLAMVYQIVDKIVFDMIAGGSEQKYLAEI